MSDREQKIEEEKNEEQTVEETITATEIAEIKVVEQTVIPSEQPTKPEKETAADEENQAEPVEEAAGQEVVAEDSDETDEEEITSSDEEDTDTSEAEAETPNYHDLDQKSLIDALDKLLKTRSVQDIKNDVHEIKTEFEALFDEERNEKKEAFLAEGGNIIDFSYTSPLRSEFQALYFEYKEKRNKYYQTLKKDLQANLTKRLELIEELKGLLAAEENINTTFNHYKDIQERWREAGPIPKDAYNTVWNNYHHHVENFYDFLHLNREFRDLDFKHNLEQKLKIITRAEELATEADINRAFRELQMLHKMWKEEIGPVDKEHREEIWERFSAATKLLHDRRAEQQQTLMAEYETNLAAKTQIIQEIVALSESTEKSHKGWQQGIKKLETLRTAFFAAGKVPYKQSKENWTAFKDAVRTFNREKNRFYKDQKQEQYTNLEKKRELLKIAEENKDNTDFEATTPLMKKIQGEWKAIGHVPRKYSDKIWKAFKAACNHYFDRIHAERNQNHQEEMEAFEKKKALLESLGQLELTGETQTDSEKVKEVIARWKTSGRVPFNKKNIEAKFNKAVDTAFKKIGLDKKEAELIKYDNKLTAMSERDDAKKMQNERFFISKKISETQDAIRQLENNLGFFQYVDENNPMVRDVRKNIDRHKSELEVWQAKLKKLKAVM